MRVLKWLGYHILNESWKALNRYVEEAYGGWKGILETAVEKGYEAAKRALQVGTSTLCLQIYLSCYASIPDFMTYVLCLTLCLILRS